MPLGRKVGLSPGHILLHGDPALSPEVAQPPSFQPMSNVAKLSPMSATAEYLYVMLKWWRVIV